LKNVKSSDLLLFCLIEKLVGLEKTGIVKIQENKQARWIDKET